MQHIASESKDEDDFIICVNCGTQYPQTLEENKIECQIYEDPRYFVRPAGTTFTTLKLMRSQGYQNRWQSDSDEQNIMFVTTRPSFAMDRRACLIRTPSGNILWDLIPFLNQNTVKRIKYLGNLLFIVLPSPHSYTTYAVWAREFDCPVVVSPLDSAYCQQFPWSVRFEYLTSAFTKVMPNEQLYVLMTGGPFPGSLIMYYDRKLFLADTVTTAPSALNTIPGTNDTISYAFLWSRVNHIPMFPTAIALIWDHIKQFDFDCTHGAFAGTEVATTEADVILDTGGTKGRFLQSCKSFIANIGYVNHPIMMESLLGFTISRYVAKQGDFRLIDLSWTGTRF